MRLWIPALALLAGCAEELVSPAPSVDGVEPALACNDQFVSTLVVHGKELTPLPVDLVTDQPKLTLPLIELTRTSELDGSAGPASDPVSMVDHTRWVDDQTMEIDIDPAEALTPGGYDVTATNPDDRADTAELALAIVPPPTASALEPDLVCLAQGDVAIDVVGSGFLVVDGIVPTITIGGTDFWSDGAEECFQLVGPMDVQSCNRLPLTLEQDAVPVGLHDVVLTNPIPANCSSTEALTLQVFPPPTLTSVQPVLECDDGSGLTFVLTGADFLQIDGVLPTVTIGPWSGSATTMEGCSADPNGGADQICTGLTVDVPAGQLPTGLHDVVVANPPPVGCVTTEVVQVEVLGPPTFDPVTPFVPSASCSDAADLDLVVAGGGFLFLDAPYPGEVRRTPLVVIGTAAWTDDPASAPAGTTVLGVAQPSGTCVPLTTIAGQVCDQVVVTIPAGTFPLGSHPAVLTNPPPADCESSSSPATFNVTNPPDITGVQPPRVCDNGQTFQVVGTDFAVGATVLLNGQDVAAAGGTVVVDPSGTFIDVTLPYGFGGGIYDVTVINVAGCEDTELAALEIVEMPIVFFVDPPVTYTGIEIQATIYVSGINDGVTSVTLEEAATGALFPITDFLWDPADPGQIQAVLPAGLTEGDYHVHVVDDLGCDPRLDDALYEEDDLTFDIAAVDPPFGWDQDYTPVEITGVDPNGFQNVPRVYLNPVGGAGTGGSQLATELTGVDFKDGDTLNAVVPSGMPVDTYDVLVINPDASIGLFAGGFQVVPEQPPIIDSVSPATFPNSGDLPIVIYGEGFLNPTVETTCIEPGVAGSETLPVTVLTSTLTQIDGLFPAGSLATSTGVCTITVYSDYTDGYANYSTWSTYAAVSVTNPSQNLYAWRAGTDLTTPRRAPAATAGRSTRIARNLYAIGGDDGGGNPYTSIEAAPVGQFGDLSPWAELPVRHELPAPRTLAGVARWGRFIYLVGGNDGVTAVDTAWRAQILDPLEAPRIASDLVLDLGTGVELDGGTYVYKVAALFDASYDDNPDGESLPSDPFVVRVPDRPEKIVLTLSWDAVPGASGYRIYRSTSGSGFETWHADVVGLTYQDTGVDPDPYAPEAGLTPLPQGALGTWSALAPMTTTREGGCAAIGVNPAAPDQAFLYLAGGRDAGGTVLDSVEYLALQEVDEHDHEVVAGWTTSATPLPSARWQCQAFVATNELHPSVTPGDTWIYFGGGQVQGGSEDGTLDARRVGPTGEFDSVVTGLSGMSNQAGYVIASASDFLYALGGSGSGPTTNAFSARMCAAPSEAGCGSPPELKNWNSLAGGGLLVPRYLAGSSQESSVIFAVGGETNADAATTSTEFTNY